MQMVVDSASCVFEGNSDERFLVDHYSPHGNEAVANCVYQAVRKALFPAVFSESEVGS